MHTRIATYRITNGTFEEIAQRARQAALPILQDAPGFIRYGLADAADGTFLSVSLWSDRREAERASVLLAAWVAENMADRVALVASQVGDFGFYEGGRSAL